MKWKILLLGGILLLVSFVSALTYVDDTEADFDAGTYYNTSYNSTYVQLNS